MKKLALLAALVFIATRKKYTINMKPIIIPSLSPEGRKFSLDRDKIRTLVSNLTIRFSDGKWVVEPKPTSEFYLPVRLELPATSPLVLPEIAFQLKTKLKYEPIKILGKTVAYKVYLKSPITIYV